MTLSYLRNILFFSQLLFIHLVRCADPAVTVSGAAITTRFWDCCKPSCGWNGKAKFSHPVQSCAKNESPLRDFMAGTGCNGGNAYSCADQQPWAINDTLSYGYAGIFITGHVEDFWCCACYRLDFTSGPVKGKSMIVQASNTAYDVSTTNRFSLAVPGGNTTSMDGCAGQYGVSQTVFGEMNSGVQSKSDCAKLPTSLRPGCEWRFDWFKNALYPTANFTRVVCPNDISERTGCSRDDEEAVASNIAASKNATASPAAKGAAAGLTPNAFTAATAIFAAAAVIFASVLSV